MACCWSVNFTVSFILGVRCATVIPFAPYGSAIIARTQKTLHPLFFKKLKQNTVVKAYFGTTENAVRSQVWIALIATLLLQILFQRSRDHRYFSTFNWVMRQSLWKYIRLEQILNPSILGRDEPEASCEESPQMELPFGKVGPLKPKICVFSFKSTNYFFDAQIRFGQ